jgi:hypothetical protein
MRDQPGDLSTSHSGAAARLITHRWTQLRRAGHLDAPRLERDRPEVRHHLGTIVVGTALVALGLAGIIL